MKNTRYAIFLASFIALLSFTACGEVGDKPAPKTTKADSSSVIDSSSVVDSKQDDSSSSDSKTTTTASSKETTSVTTTSIVVLKDGKGNIVTQFAVGEDGKTIPLDKDGKPKTTTTKKSGSGSSSSGKTTTKKTSNGSSNNTTGSVTYQTNSGGSSGYSGGNSGYSDNGGYSYDNGGNSGSSGGSSGGSGSSGGGAVNTTTTTTTTRAPEPEPEPVVWDGYTLDWWLQSDFRSKDDYINIGRGLSNDGSDLSKAKAVYKYMLTTYKSEHPDVNCISYASATYALCKGIGLDCRYILYSDWYNHVSTAVYVDDGWYDMDTSVGMLGDKSSSLERLGDCAAFTQMCDEYENYGDISCLSPAAYNEYRTNINGTYVRIGMSEEEAIEYHKNGTIPDWVYDKIEYYKQII